jgi:hypothetical protein
MQDALGGKAIHAGLRSLTNTCSAGLFDCEADPCLQGAMSVLVKSQRRPARLGGPLCPL